MGLVDTHPIQGGEIPQPFIHVYPTITTCSKEGRGPARLPLLWNKLNLPDTLCLPRTEFSVMLRLRFAFAMTKLLWHVCRLSGPPLSAAPAPARPLSSVILVTAKPSFLGVAVSTAPQRSVINLQPQVWIPRLAVSGAWGHLRLIPGGTEGGTVRLSSPSFHPAQPSCWKKSFFPESS